MFIPRKILEEKLQKILAEDIGQGDITTALIAPPEKIVEAHIIVKENGVAAGIEEAKILLESLSLKVETLTADGARVKAGTVLMKIFGNARTILTAERTVLNILSRMSGIATTTRMLVEKIRKTKLQTKIACTRKTAPGLLYFDKKAVLIGGGDTHRLHLDDMILIKDNHIAVVGSIKRAIAKAKEKASFSKKIEVEVSKIEDALNAAEAGVDIIMLDNFTPKKIREAIELLKKEGFYGKVMLEASGGITTKNFIEFASTGVDVISLGEITASPKTLDISLEVIAKN
ncbi:MAG: carboxylating nicotinate-nucleotide diphosphorylase [Candidatus Bathyarchaeia archaeon]|nr:MAG: nicotinate-nucleotide diphosphorylase (carboxylating) [Candidatus Bathyarchaeota archaeon]